MSCLLCRYRECEEKIRKSHICPCVQRAAFSHEWAECPFICFRRADSSERDVQLALHRGANISTKYWIRNTLQRGAVVIDCISVCILVHVPVDARLPYDWRVRLPTHDKHSWHLQVQIDAQNTTRKHSSSDTSSSNTSANSLSSPLFSPAAKGETKNLKPTTAASFFGKGT